MRTDLLRITHNPCALKISKHFWTCIESLQCEDWTKSVICLVGSEWRHLPGHLLGRSPHMLGHSPHQPCARVSLRCSPPWPWGAARPGWRSWHPPRRSGRCSASEATKWKVMHQRPVGVGETPPILGGKGGVTKACLEGQEWTDPYYNSDGWSEHPKRWRPFNGQQRTPSNHLTDPHKTSSEHSSEHLWSSRQPWTATSNKKLLGALTTIGARTLLRAPGIATRSKDATRGRLLHLRPSTPPASSAWPARRHLMGGRGDHGWSEVPGKGATGKWGPSC